MSRRTCVSPQDEVIPGRESAGRASLPSRLSIRKTCTVFVTAVVIAGCGGAGDLVDRRPDEFRGGADGGTDEAAAGTLETTAVEFGFIRLTDCAPLVVAKELGYFEDEGLDVTLSAQPDWQVLLDRVVAGELDGAHMLAGQPIAAAGVGTEADLIVPYNLAYNGNGITVSPRLWEAMRRHDPSLDWPTQVFPTAEAAAADLLRMFDSPGIKAKPPGFVPSDCTARS